MFLAIARGVAMVRTPRSTLNGQKLEPVRYLTREPVVKDPELKRTLAEKLMALAD